MKVEWVKTRQKEITPDKIEEAYAKGAAKIVIRKGKSGHAKAQKLAQMKDKEK